MVYAAITWYHASTCTHHSINHHDFLQTNHIADPLITLQHRLDGILQREHQRSQLLQTQDILCTWTSHRTANAHHVLTHYIPDRRSHLSLTTFRPLSVSIVTSSLGILVNSGDIAPGFMESEKAPIEWWTPHMTHFLAYPLVLDVINLSLLGKISNDMWKQFAFFHLCRIHRAFWSPEPNKGLSSDLQAMDWTIYRPKMNCWPSSVIDVRSAISLSPLTNTWRSTGRLNMQMHSSPMKSSTWILLNKLFFAEGWCTVHFLWQGNQKCSTWLPATQKLSHAGCLKWLTRSTHSFNTWKTLSCSHCDRKFLTHNGLQMHLQKKHAQDCKGSVAFIVERDCLPRATACAHCGTAFNCMSSEERQNRGGKCKEFNPDLPVCTLISTHDRLRELVTQDKLAEILRDDELKELLYLTCGLCQQTFRYRGSLGNHFVSRHASVVSAVRFEVLDLEAKHRGRALSCFCVNGHDRKSRAHRCVIFQQYAMLRHYIITSNQAIAPVTPDPTADLLVKQMGDLLDADTDMDNDDMDATTDADLAMLLQEQLPSQEESSRSRTDHTCYSSGCRLLQQFPLTLIQQHCTSWTCLPTAHPCDSMIMWWTIYMIARFSMCQRPSTTLPRVTTWRYGMMQQLFILCPATVYVATRVFHLMKLLHISVCIGVTSQCFPDKHILNVLRNSCKTFASCRGFKTYHAIKQFCIKSFSSVC